MRVGYLNGKNKMKQVIVIRKDLNMRKGKMVAQGAHASMAVFFNRIKAINGKSIVIKIDGSELEWILGTFTKICVGVDSEKELLKIYARAVGNELPASIIEDCGLTEFHGVPTNTAVAIGPAEDEIIDKITGHLKLL